MSRDRLQFGIVGAGGARSAGLRDAIEARDDAEVSAICDSDAEALETARERFDAVTGFSSYETMLSEGNLDAVVISTPPDLHAPMAIAALERDVHVLSEVPAAESLEGSRKLVAAEAASDAQYMMGENTTYFPTNTLVSELVSEGLFGDLQYAEGEYLLEERDLMTSTWRRELHIGVNGITYPTHSLGPPTTWLGDDRIQRITCAGSGHRYRGEMGDYELEDTTVLFGKTEGNRLVKVRLDMISNRPASKRNNKYQLQGTGGCYESATGRDERDKLWLAEFHEAESAWDREFVDIFEFESKLPDRYRNPPPAVEAADSPIFTADYFEVQDFVDAVTAGDRPPIDVHDALDMTLPGLISRKSIADDSEWKTVPDSREW
jgi:predicted dehydrogenase